MADAPLSYPDPLLSDGRVSLRRWEEGDLECIRLAGTDPDIPRGTTVPAVFSPAEGLAFLHRQRARLDNGEGVSQAIVDATGDRAIGLMWLALRPQPHVGGLGYWIVPQERGRGAATAAVRLVVPWALSALDLRRVEAWVLPENVASQHVLRNAGFVEEGRLRSFLTIRGSAADALVFSAVRHDQ